MEIKIEDQQWNVDTTKMSHKHRVVLDIIIANTYNATAKITQRQIANCEQWLGCHRVHEEEVIPKARQYETTLREVRQIIRDLRLLHRVPIISDVKGYWIPAKLKEVDETIARMERTAKSQAGAWFETYRAMRGIFTIESEYFEAQTKLF